MLPETTYSLGTLLPRYLKAIVPVYVDLNVQPLETERVQEPQSVLMRPVLPGVYGDGGVYCGFRRPPFAHFLA